MKMLSKNLSLNETITSQTATRKKINNTPTPAIIQNLEATAQAIFQPIREHFGVPIRVSSGYRSPALNLAVGGARNSQHLTGQALDLQGTNGITNAQIYHFAKDNLNFDQLIWEFGTDKEPAWVHISYRKDGKNRKQVLRVR